MPKAVGSEAVLNRSDDAAVGAAGSQWRAFHGSAEGGNYFRRHDLATDPSNREFLPMHRLVPTAIAALALTAAAGFSPAAARMTLNQCISKNESCRAACNPFDPKSVELPDSIRVRACERQCERNHGACVDAAMSLSRSGSEGPAQPPKGAINSVPTGGLLDQRSGFGAAGPAPAGAVAPRPPAPGPVIR
ncbi:MAG: hypothetical protein K2Z80_14440 [Xanthobacteraceae bacterium]|nr:hypothetical protein [Xanthobacteraceae bacterium]